jgi:hypothetical protein
MLATVLWVVNKIPRTLKVLPCRHDVEEVVRLWIATTKASILMAWRDPHTAAQYRIRQKTHEFIAEANLFQWLTNQNSKGVVPSSRLMITEFLQRWPWQETPKVKHLPNSLVTGSDSTLRNWAWRFRGRWGLKIGKLPVSPDVSPQEIKHKAWIQNVTPFLVQKSTPIQGSHRLFLYSEPAQKRPQKWIQQWRCFAIPMQAQLYFQWINYAVRQCPDDKSVLFVNLDETSVAHTYASQLGVVLRKRKHLGDATAFKEKSTLGDRRAR